MHPSSELYGSDRSFADALIGLREAGHRVTVVLAKDGPLVELLRSSGFDVRFHPLAQIHRSMFSPSGLVHWIVDMLRGSASIVRICRGEDSFEAVYVDTVSLPIGALVAARMGIPLAWHVREIILRPRVVSSFLRWLVDRTGDLILCNSQATLRWLVGDRAADSRHVVVWNGVDPDAPGRTAVLPEERLRERMRLGIDDRFVVLVPGRINAWKGQDLVVDAVESMPEAIRMRCLVVFLGDVAENGECWRTALQDRVSASRNPSVYSLAGFHPDPAPFFAAADVVVVPSKEPEPFGRVAIEAMSRGRAVIAAAHGGLLEIVDPGDTGWLFPPRDVAALRDALLEGIGGAEELDRRGVNARIRIERVFSLRAYQDRIVQELSRIAGRRKATRKSA